MVLALKAMLMLMIGNRTMTLVLRPLVVLVAWRVVHVLYALKALRMPPSFMERILTSAAAWSVRKG